MKFDREPSEILANTVQKMLASHGLDTPSDNAVSYGNSQFYWTEDGTMGVTHADTDHKLTFAFDPSDPSIHEGSVGYPTGNEVPVRPENTTAFAVYLLRLLADD